MDNNPFYKAKEYQMLLSCGYEKSKISPMCSAINYFIDKLDLDHLNKKNKSNNVIGGRPFFDRKILLKLVLFAIYKKVSIRNIDKQFSLENEFSYLLEPYKTVPKRQSFSRFLEELDSNITLIFKQFIEIIKKEYKLDLENLYCDGTIFDAHNDRHKVITKTNIQRSTIKWNRVLQDTSSTEEQIIIAKKKLALDEERIKKLEELGRNSFGRTDIDCFLVQDKNKSFIAGYNAQLVEEKREGLIVFVHVSNKNPDSEVFQEMLPLLLEVYDFKSMTLDAGYGTMEILKKFKDLDKQIVTITRKDKDDQDIIYISDLIFNEDYSIGICPAKKEFLINKPKSKERNKLKYTCPDCKECINKSKCKLNKDDGLLTINLQEYEVVSQAKKVLKSDFGKNQYRLRGNICESPNGYFKGFLRVKKLTMNGIKRTLTMVYLYSFLYNFQRLISVKNRENKKG